MIPTITPVRRWACPHCKVTSITREARPHSRMHTCVGLKGLIAPLIEEGVKVKVTAHERQDYVGNEQVRRDADGRPMMSVVTEHSDGRTDAIVFAPTATASARE